MTSSQNGSLNFAVVLDNDAFESLADEWTELLSQVDNTSVFMQWEWHFTWWQIFAGNRDVLHIMTWRQDNKLVGVLPLYRQRRMMPGSCCLKFIGTGERDRDEVATEYCDLLVHNSVQDDVAADAVRHLLGFENWQRFELISMLESALLAQSLLSKQRINMITSPAGLRYRVPLGSSEEQYLSSLSRSKAKRIKRSQRALEKEGGIEATQISSVEEVQRALWELADLNHERQDHKKRKSVFASSLFLAFHHDLCLRLYHSGAVNIVRFHMGPRLLAVLYCFYDEKSCFYYQSGFTRKDANRFMPLTMAHLLEMQRNRDAGRQYYDLMRGRPPSYKDELACETTPMVDVCVFKSVTIRQCVMWYRSLRSATASLIKGRLVKNRLQ